MEIIKHYLANNQYFTNQYKKDSIWLHHTAGASALTAIQWWNQTKDHVGTAYVIERNGKIYEAFAPESYAYHLGVSTDDNHYEKSGIGIELVTYGYVIKEADGFYAYPLFPNKSVRKKIADDDVVTLDKPFRGFQHYQKITDAQIKATIELCESLTQKFGIKVQDDLTNFYEFNDSILKTKPSGIFAHSTVRKDKFDVFPQPNYLKALYDKFNKPKPVVEKKK
jgi:N-acetyl-anhydromuramyl-L-alanine amidase AmpD